MPRKKKGGSRGPSPEKFFSPGGGAVGQQFSNGGNGPPWSSIVVSSDNNEMQSQEREQILHQVQEMFMGKVDADVIHMVLQESDWKVDDAIEKLCELTPQSDGELDQKFSNMSLPLNNTSHARAISIPNSGIMHDAFQHRRSRLPTGPTEDISISQEIPMLSPKTPSMVGDSFPEMFTNSQKHAQQQHMQSAFDALDSYANAPQMNVTYSQNYSQYRGDVYNSKPNNQQQPQMPNFNVPPPAVSPNNQVQQAFLNVVYQSNQDYQPAQISPNAMAVPTCMPNSSMANAFIPHTSSDGVDFQMFDHHQQPQTSMPYSTNSSIINNHAAQQAFMYAQGGHHNDTSPQPAPNNHVMPQVSQADTAEACIIPGLPFIRKGARKKTLSLNPEEREALENLIEDVIIGGLGEGVIDSGEEEPTSSESEDEKSTHSPSEKRQSSNQQQKQHSAKSNQSPQSGQNQQQANKNKDGKASTNASQGNLKPKTNKSKDVNNKEAQKAVAAASDPQQKVYPPQLKVAVKHMKNLPPRFLRKLQTTPKEDGSTSSSSKSDSEAEAKSKLDKEKQNEKEKKETVKSSPQPPTSPPQNQQIPQQNQATPTKNERKTKEEQKLEKKKRIRGMLEGLDQYIDESTSGMNVMDDSREDAASPNVQNSTDLSPGSGNHNYGGGDNSGPSSAADVNQRQSQDTLHLLQQLMISQQQQQGQQQRPNMMPHAVLNCEELERELLQGGVSQQTPEPSRNAPQWQTPPPLPPVSSEQQAIFMSPGGQQTNLAVLQKMVQQQQHMNNMANTMPSNQFGALAQQFYAGQHGMAGVDDMGKSKFSVDAPEFVPRSFTPGSLGQFQQQQQQMNLDPQMQQQILSHQQQQQKLMMLSAQQQAMGPLKVSSAYGLGAPPRGSPQMQQQLPAVSASQQQQQQQQQLSQEQQFFNSLQGRNSPAAHQPPTFLIPKVSQAGGGGSGLTGGPPTSHMSGAPLMPPSVAAAYQQYHNLAGHQGFPISQPGFQPALPPPPHYTAVSAPFLAHPWPGGKKQAATAATPMQSPRVAGSAAPGLVSAACRPHPPPHTAVTAAQPSTPLTSSGGGPQLLHQPHGRPVRELRGGPATRAVAGALLGGGNNSRLIGGILNQQIMSPKMAKRGQNELTAQKARDRIKSLVNGGKKVLVLLRGPPGSGKSTLAREIQFSGKILSTDDFFMKDGLYDFQPDKLPDAHNWNRKRAEDALSKQDNPVVIDNTNTQAWEMRAYVSLALQYDYHVEIIEPDTPWKFNPKELAQRNTHGVPRETIEKMLDRYEHSLTIERIMAGSAITKRREDLVRMAVAAGAEPPVALDVLRSGRRRKRRRRRKDRDRQKDLSKEDEELGEQSSDEDEVEQETLAFHNMKNKKMMLRKAEKNLLNALDHTSSAPSQPNSTKENSEESDLSSVEEDSVMNETISNEEGVVIEITTDGNDMENGGNEEEDKVVSESDDEDSGDDEEEVTELAKSVAESMATDILTQTLENIVGERVNDLLDSLDGDLPEKKKSLLYYATGGATSESLPDSELDMILEEHEMCKTTKRTKTKDEQRKGNNVTEAPVSVCSETSIATSSATSIATSSSSTIKNCLEENDPKINSMSVEDMTQCQELSPSNKSLLGVISENESVTKDVEANVTNSPKENVLTPALVTASQVVMNIPPECRTESEHSVPVNENFIGCNQLNIPITSTVITGANKLSESHGTTLEQPLDCTNIPVSPPRDGDAAVPTCESVPYLEVNSPPISAIALNIGSPLTPATPKEDSDGEAVPRTPPSSSTQSAQPPSSPKEVFKMFHAQVQNDVNLLIEKMNHTIQDFTGLQQAGTGAGSDEEEEGGEERAGAARSRAPQRGAEDAREECGGDRQKEVKDALKKTADTHKETDDAQKELADRHKDSAGNGDVSVSGNNLALDSNAKRGIGASGNNQAQGTSDCGNNKTANIGASHSDSSHVEDIANAVSNEIELELVNELREGIANLILGETLVEKAAKPQQDSATASKAECVEKEGIEDDDVWNLDDDFAVNDVDDGEQIEVNEEEIRVEHAYWEAAKSTADPYGLFGCTQSENVQALQVQKLELLTREPPKPQRQRRNRSTDSEFTGQEPEDPWGESSSASQSPLRKPHKAQRNTPQLKQDPKLRSTMLEQLKNRADAIPDYDAATSELKALDVTALSIPVIKLKESATNTSIEEFNLVERLSRGAEDRAQMVALFVSTRRCQPRVLSEAVTLLSSGHSTPSCLSPSRRLVKFDKSCDTKDLEEQEAATVDGGLLFLKNCFPAVNNDDLGEILSRCEGDTEWAVNILLDSGYEYNVEGSEVDQNSNVVNEEFEDDVDVPQELELGEPSSDESRAMKSEPICIPSTSSMTPLNLPSPLLELCHQIVSPTEPSPSKLQETVAENSMLRLKTIDEFRKSHNSKKESIARAKTVVSKAPVLGFSVGFDVPYEVEEKPHITTKKSMFKDQVLPQNDVGETEASGQTNALQNLAYCYGEDVNEEAEHAVPNHQQESPRPSRSLSMLSDSPLAVDSSLTLTLSKELASQLINMFGPVGFHISPESLDEGDLRVCLSRNVARNLHRCWAQTMHEKFDMEENAIQQMMQEDERLARQLQHEENAATTSLGGRDVLHVTPAGVAPPTGGPQDEDLTLREIMDEEMALELSRKEFHQSQKKKVLNWGDDMSTNLKRQKLRQLFPNIDPVMLNEVFKANGFSLEDSVGAIELSHGKPNPAPEDDTLTPTEIQQIQRAKVSSMSEQWLGEDETDSYQSYSDPAYQDFRAEASMHYRLRHECFQKAQEAYRRNMKQAAAFYSQQGHLHTMKLRQANMRAAEKILAYQNQVTSDPSSLDLHGLHVNEAIYVLQAKIGALEAECRGQKVHLSVVTGRGAHSKDGKAKIRPAVLSWLKKNAYRYTEPQEGLLRITLKYRE